MALTYSQQGKGPTALGARAPEFSLPAVDGKTYSLSNFSGAKGLLVIFMCNHCPYVKAIQSRLVQIGNDFIPKGVGMIGINPNDSIRYPEDSFEAMKRIAREWKYPFVYAQDESQEVARAYDAVCTPDIYLYQNFNSVFRLAYHGRMDDSWKDGSKVKTRELRDALEILISVSDSAVGKSVEEMKQEIFNKITAISQHPSMGCSIKWKE